MKYRKSFVVSQRTAKVSNAMAYNDAKKLSTNLAYMYGR